MASNYLFRGGHRIELEKEAEFFTTIISEKSQVREIARMQGVHEMRRVFDRVYKIRTRDYERDDLMDQLRRSDRLQNICHHAYRPKGDPGTRYYLTDKLVLQFSEEVTDGHVEEVLRAHGLRYLRQYPREQRTFLVQVTATAGKNPVKVCADLNERAGVQFAEPNLVNRFQHFYEPRDNYFRNQWHLHSEGGVELLEAADVDAPAAWDTTRGSRQVVVAIIDDGFDLQHPDLRGDGKVVFPKDYVDSDREPLPTRERGDFHGTPVAGVAIGEENGEGIVGIAPGAAFLPIRFDLAADDNQLFEIFEYAGERADIISNSWGPVPVYAPLSSLLHNQLSRLAESGGRRGKGCLILFASGNYNAPVRDMENERFTWRHPRQGLRETRGPILNGHAAHPGVMAIAASTSQNRKSAYSNWGKEISVSAPSDNWHPLQPQERLPGRGILTTDNEQRGLGFTAGSRYTSDFGGTSSATPLAAGVAALVISANSELSAQAVREVLEQTTDKITDDQPDPVLHLRKGNYDANGRSEWFGYGKINAAKAVQRATELLGPPAPQPEPEPEPAPTESIHIIAALVNAEGFELGAEKILLLNVSDQAVNLENWWIEDGRGRVDTIGPVQLDAHQMLPLTVFNARLTNSGATISLKDPRGVLIDKAEYGAEEGKNEGWLVRF